MNLFVIGAGFTKSFFPEAPLNNELLEAIGIGNTESASQYLKKTYKTNDIEIALTKLDADIATSYYSDRSLYDELKGIRGKIEIDLGNYFLNFKATYELLDNSPWFKHLLYCAFSEGDVAVSLNYDCVFEGALDCIGKWTPRGGYGFLENPLIDDSAFEQSPVTVLKIHGSTSFIIAPYADKPHCNSVDFAFDEWYFPNSAKNTHFGYGAGTGKTYLIAPSYVKIPTVEMTYFMLDALKAASESLKLIIIGCSLRPEDSFLTLLLTHFLRQPQWRIRKIIVLDRSADIIASRIRSFWGVSIEECIVPINGSIEHSIEDLCEMIKK